jgi:hypothetical protein
VDHGHHAGGDRDSEFGSPVPVFACALKGGGVMRRILQEIVLFSCLAAFVTGVVIAAASLFG